MDEQSNYCTCGATCRSKISVSNFSHHGNQEGPLRVRMAMLSMRAWLAVILSICGLVLFSNILYVDKINRTRAAALHQRRLNAKGESDLQQDLVRKAETNNPGSVQQQLQLHTSQSDSKQEEQQGKKDPQLKEGQEKSNSQTKEEQKKSDSQQKAEQEKSDSQQEGQEKNDPQQKEEQKSSDSQQKPEQEQSDSQQQAGQKGSDPQQKVEEKSSDSQQKEGQAKSDSQQKETQEKSGSQQKETQEKSDSQQEGKEKTDSQQNEKPGSVDGEKQNDGVKDPGAGTSRDVSETTEPLPLCPSEPPKLVGKLLIDVNKEVKMDAIVKVNPEVKLGGFFSPPDCQPRDTVAIVIPFRDRNEHLLVFLYYMIPIFRRQLIQFKIYIIEQAGNCNFNRGMLLNAGALEAAKDYNWQCYCLHDIDLIMEDDRNLYTCPERPKHLSVAVDKFNYKLSYFSLFGGITMFRKEQFWKINGYSNMYWGWGAEDDDLYKRVVAGGMKIMRPDEKLARYKMIRGPHHAGSKQNPGRFDLLSRATFRMKTDGLNSVSYKVVSQQQHSLYTHITVELKDHVNC